MSYTKLRQTLAEGLVTAYQLPEDDIVTLLPEKEEDFNESEFKTKFLELDSNRITAINQKGSKKFDEGYKKATSEVLSKSEKEIKDKYGIDDADLKGLDLIDKVVELSSKAQKTDFSKLSEEDLKKHPAFIKIQNEKDKTFKEREQQLQDEFDSKLKDFSRKELFGKVEKRAISLLDSMNPVLSEDPVKAANQKKFLTLELQGLDFQQEGDEFIPLKDGKRLEDGHGHGITFEKFVKGKAASLYDFKQADDRGTPPPGGDGGSGGSTKAPKSEAEYAKVMSDRSIPLEERQKIKANWNNKQAAS
ncbi:hypothetical protein [Winogradskyella forsetii]|uniref:hypothetical protein n=1 Tax=Winogradskyella forsetii TaxID=2686077 RepID=UPI0015BD738B|nr:hypothetical protein [Winogradskyella forsetii]